MDRPFVGAVKAAAKIQCRQPPVAQTEPHIVSANSSRPISMRRISLVPAPIS
jgi:hypothetical protein